MEIIEIEYDDAADEVVLKFEEALKKIGVNVEWETEDSTIIFKMALKGKV